MIVDELRGARREAADASIRWCLPAAPDLDARASFGADFNIERRFEHLLEQFALIDLCGGSNAKTFAAMQQHDLVGNLRSQAQLVRHDVNGLTLFFG